MLGNYMNLSLDEAIKKINVPNTDIEIKSKDIKYKLKTNNKELEREETIIVFGNIERLKLMNNNDIEYFIDTTFKIMPKKYNPYKLLTIAIIDYVIK